MSISSTESNRQPGIYAQYPQNGQFESNYVVHTSDTGRVVPGLLEGQVPPSPPPLRSNRFCCLRVMDRVGSCLANLCRKISRCFTAFLRGLTQFFKTLYCHGFSNGSSQIRNDQRIIPIEIPAPQPDLEINEIESLNQFVERCVNLNGAAVTEEIEQEYSEVWNLFSQCHSREKKLAWLNRLPQYIQIKFLNHQLNTAVARPCEFLCPISFEIMADPHHAMCANVRQQHFPLRLSKFTPNHVFERSWINEWLGLNNNCPVDRTFLHINCVFRDDRMQNRILNWLKEQLGLIN